MISVGMRGIGGMHRPSDEKYKFKLFSLRHEVCIGLMRKWIIANSKQNSHGVHRVKYKRSQECAVHKLNKYRQSQIWAMHKIDTNELGS